MSSLRKDPRTRSHLRIRRPDLLRLLDLAVADRRDFFRRHPDRARLYSDRVLCVALCQGAGLHFIDPTVGINDFDVYTFYAHHPSRRWYSKRIAREDFGDARFGRSQHTQPGYIGRRVDLNGRELPDAPSADPVRALRRYLMGRRTRTAVELAKKGVVLLWPQLGRIVWPIPYRRGHRK